MHGLMMQIPLLVSQLLAHADRQHGATEIVSRSVEGPLHRTTYREVHRRARQLASALAHLGVAAGDRVATLAWNTWRHLEVYYAVSGSGAVVHTVNPRLFDDQVVYILNHAESRVLFFDLTFAPLVARVAKDLPHVRHFVLLSDREHLQTLAAEFPVPVDAYEDLVHSHSDQLVWPALDENTAAGLCYTSGTTGHPKGVLYSHRSHVLHAYACALPDSFNLSARDVVMPVVPMYHVNAWGLPYIAPLVGAKLVLPGPRMDGESLHALTVSEGVTFSAAVPTVWQAVLQHLETIGQGAGTPIGQLQRLVIGGSACPPAMIDAFADYGVSVLHAWGMTELSPIGAINAPKADASSLGREEALRRRAKQGRPLPGVELAILDDAGHALPHDGASFGELVVRSPWACRAYYRRDDGQGAEGKDSGFIDGWFRTGDVATIDAAGYMQITDRAKDVIKSGGEWISSIELENILVAHPAVQEAAAVAVPHPKWDERPLMAVVLKSGTGLDRETMRRFYEGKVARWWIPDDLVVVPEIPHTATGKINKRELRERLRAGLGNNDR